MGIHIDELSAIDAVATVHLASETRGWDGDEAEYVSPVLRLSNGDIEVRITGTVEDLIGIANQALFAAKKAEQRELSVLTGFKVGDEVRIGKGKVLWVVQEFSRGHGGTVFVALKDKGGYGNTTAVARRLVRVDG